ncbi:MAG: hypothetical protein IKV21_05455 [Clostridia bacterium]|nr:hypothetical protein [Clostridia bacterium]
MKIKESKDISIYGKMPLIFLLTAAACVALRFVQVFFFIDRETGFYTGGGAVTFALYLIIAVASVLFASVSFMSKETGKVTLEAKKDKGFTVLSALLCTVFLYDSLVAFVTSFDSLGSASYGVSAFQSMMLSGAIPKLFQSIFALFSAFYFISYTRSISKEAASFTKHKIIAVAPVGWAGFRLIHRFIEQISYIRVSELLLELVMLALLCLFFMAFAQLSSGVYLKNSRWRIMGIGLPCALISLTLNLPRMVFVVLKGADALSAKYPFNVCDFVLALFILVLAVKNIRESQNAENS